MIYLYIALVVGFVLGVVIAPKELDFDLWYDEHNHYGYGSPPTSNPEDRSSL